VNTRLTFLSHFVLCLAIAAAAFFAEANGVFRTVYLNDLSMMTSAIAALLIATMAALGWQAWRAGEPRKEDGGQIGDPFSDACPPSSDFGHLAERLAVMMGFVGTAIGLSLQAHALAGGATSFQALATSLFTTATGGTTAALIAVMTYNLERGIARARR
jgi:hypothetical protein